MGTAPSHERYVFKPFTGSSHNWALRKLLSLPRNSRILDVGAGSGAIGQALKQEGFSDLSAIEIDDAARSHICTIYSRVVPNIDDFRGERFDAVILLDILEHLPDPFKAFHDFCSGLSPGGQMVISVPNIAHWSVRFQLLFGSFEYTDRGILDRTHLQFFTRRRLEKMIASESGIRTVEMSASIEPAELVLPEWLWDNSFFSLLSRLRCRLAQLTPGIMAYQHLAHLART